MFDKFINSLIASVVGCITAIGTVWYLSDQQDVTLLTESGAKTTGGHSVKLHSLEVDQIKIKDGLVLVDAQTGKPLVEIKREGIFAQNEIIADSLSTEGLKTRKVQLVKGDLKDQNAAVYGELGLKKEGGSYLALLSARQLHSVNMGFNDQETGFIISQNNQEDAFVAQAVFPIPRSDDAKNQKAKVTPPGQRDLNHSQSSEKVAFNSPTNSETLSPNRSGSLTLPPTGAPLSAGSSSSSGHPASIPNSSTPNNIGPNNIGANNIGPNNIGANNIAPNSSTPNNSLSFSATSSSPASGNVIPSNSNPLPPPSAGSLSLPSSASSASSQSLVPSGPVMTPPSSSYNSLPPVNSSQNLAPSASNPSTLAPAPGTSPLMTPPSPSTAPNSASNISENALSPLPTTNVSSNNLSQGVALSGASDSGSNSASNIDNNSISKSFGPSVSPVNY